MLAIMQLMRKTQASFFFFLAALIAVALYGTYYFLRTDSRRMILFATVACVALIAQYVLYTILKAKRPDASTLYTTTFSIIVWGMVYLFVFPPWTPPDETYHYFYAYQLSDILLGLGPITETTFPIRMEDFEFVTNESFFSLDFTAYSHGLIAEEIADTDIQNDVVDYQFWNYPLSHLVISSNLAANPPQDRLAPAIGIAMGRILGLNGLATFYCGRIANLLLFAALAHFALKNIPSGKSILATVAVLPMTLHTVSSYSYDSFTIGASFLLIALMLRLIVSKKKVSTGDIALLATLSALLAPCKVVYFLPVFLIFFVSKKQFGSGKRNVLAKSIIIGVAILSVVVFRIPDVMQSFGTSNSNSPDIRGSETGRFVDMQYALNHPGQIAGMYGRTIVETMNSIENTLVGGSLGWFQGNITAPEYLVVLIYMIFLAACIPSRGDRQKLTLPVRGASIALCFVCWLAIMTSMLFSHTFNHEDIIRGIQGRYALPFLPLLLVALMPKRMGSSYNLVFWCPYSLCTLNAIYIIFINAMVILAR